MTFWLKQTLTAIWHDFLHSGVAWKTKAIIMIVLIVLFSFVADFFIQVGNVLNTEFDRRHSEHTTQVMQSINHPLQDQYNDLTPKNVAIAKSFLNSSAADTLFKNLRRPVGAPEGRDFDTAQQRKEFLVQQAQSQTKNIVVRVFADNPSLWPEQTQQFVEQAFGPITSMSELEFLQHHRKNQGWVFVGYQMNDRPTWWVWHDSTFDLEEDPAVRLVNDLITGLGKAEQDQQYSLLRQSEAFQQATSWERPLQLVTYQPIDIRYIALVIVFLLFAVPSSMSAAQALTWDMYRNKGVFEPLASVQAPMWSIILKESLSRFWMMLFVFVGVAVLVGLSVERSWFYLLCVGVMIFLGLGVAFLILQINMFFMILFQSPMGRSFARLLMLPAIVLPYNIFRFFALLEIPRIFAGQTIDVINLSWYFGLGVICFGAAVVVLMITSYRVGRYRQGLAVV